MKIIIYLFVYLFIVLRSGIPLRGRLFSVVYAQTCDPTCGNAIECRDKIAKCQEAWNQMEVAKKPHVDTLRKMESQIEAFQARIKILEADLIKKTAAIAVGEKELGGLLELSSHRVRQLYIRSNTNNPLAIFLGSSDIGAVMRSLTYQMSLLDDDKKAIAQTAISVKGLEERKKTLEVERASLAYLKQETDKRAVSVRKLVGEASAYQGKLTSIIGALTAQQQEFISAKLAGLGLPTSLGAGPLLCTDDRNLNPGFGNAFAFYTYGIPHRVGMNQYGAYGRAKAGQSYQDILRAYFDGISFEKKDKNMRIKVQGFGEMGLDDYLLGVYEMPGSWPMAALKAQVVSARSYALAYTDNGAKEICTTQACQVYKGGNKGGDWEKAVRETEGEVMVRDGQVITAWYASTSGGYTFRSGDVGWNDRPWTKRMRDTNGDAGSFSDLQSRAYDRDSPCFYAAQGWRSQYGKSAWLKGDEVADIANVILLVRKTPSAACFVYQTDKAPPPPDPKKGCAQTDNWSSDRVKQELGGGAISTATSVEVTGVDWGSGRITQIKINGISFGGDEFKDYFNLRAPANIQIVGPLFNVERK